MNRPRQKERGFTLVEVLAALALASLILVSLNLAMTLIERGVRTARSSLGGQAAITAATTVFAQDTARIARIRRGPASPAEGQAGGQAEGYVFEGTARQMIYALGERQGASRAGLYVVRLRVEQEDGNARLIRERVALPAGEEPVMDGPWADAVVLLEGPFDISLAYRAQRSGARDWSASWSSPGTMPEQVRLTIAGRGTTTLRVPVIVQSLHIDAEPACAADPSLCGEPKPQGTTP